LENDSILEKECFFTLGNTREHGIRTGIASSDLGYDRLLPKIGNGGESTIHENSFS